MIRNYLRLVWRLMVRQKAYTAINIFGLSIGIASSLLITIYILDELSYDRFHADAAHIYRVNFEGLMQGNEFNSAITCAPLVEAIRHEIPEASETLHFGLWQTIPIKYGGKKMTERRMLVADSNFFQFFTFPLVSGDPATALQGPDKVVITESAAKRYFGNEDPIGKVLLRGNEKKATEVTGVAQDPPHNSHIDFDMVLSGDSWPDMKNPFWTNNNFHTYFKVHLNASTASINTKLNSFIKKYVGPEVEQYLGMSLEQFEQQGNHLGFSAVPILDIHLYSQVDEEIKPVGNIQYLYIFSAIALFIIIIACINFMNLSTARSSNRAKEVGVRKTVGALKSKLIGQFLAESMVYSFLSTFLALAFVSIAINPFNLLTGKELSFGIFSDVRILGVLLSLTLAVGLLAGSYPAFYLTSFRPAEVLKGKIRAGFKNAGLRNGLVVVQFFISIALIMGTLIVNKQLHFMQEKNLGFEKENVINLLHTMELGSSASAFKQEVLRHPEFKGASFANRLPPNITWSSVFRKSGTDKDYLLNQYYVDYDHLETMGYTIVQGRFFSRDFPSDSTAVLINESALKMMGLEKIENEKLGYYHDPDKMTELHIIGVVKDFNYESLRNNVKPIAIMSGSEPNFEMAIRLTPGETQKKVTLLQDIWNKYAPNAPFEYSFLDQNFDALFRAEQRMSRVIFIFTVLAILIACLGLFGLATFTAEQRSKEISIRKVMGASVSQVVILLSRDFTQLVLLAFIVAAPLSWYLLEEWLSSFAFHIDVDVTLIIVSGVVAVALAWLTVGFQSVKSALANPVKFLRNE